MRSVTFVREILSVRSAVIGLVASGILAVASVPAAAVSYTISNITQGDLGGANQTGVKDPDGGCDDDASFNFSGLGHGSTGITTCGDTAIIHWAGGTVGSVVTNLTGTGIGNLAGLEFHVEDSSGTGQVNGTIDETLTINGGTATFTVPYTINFGNAGDSFQIPAFSQQVCVGNCGNGRYFVISGGTSLLGSVSSNDDEWAFETNLFGCVSTSNVAACQGTAGSVFSFVANDPPAAAPEPSSLAIFGGSLAVWRWIRRRRAAD